ncbi:MAG TPA: hypothetical protein PKG71_02150 [Candidatus Woesebacteria bacterium]|jgi:hypothetical protein|nr:hypothetical protein [Candidatus Woesebacteria bacterium]HNS94747.1 hypothetical protein [Candidatus Woesebacteria bacterium]
MGELNKVVLALLLLIIVVGIAFFVFTRFGVYDKIVPSNEAGEVNGEQTPNSLFDFFSQRKKNDVREEIEITPTSVQGEKTTPLIERVITEPTPSLSPQTTKPPKEFPATGNAHLIVFIAVGLVGTGLRVLEKP